MTKSYMASLKFGGKLDPFKAHLVCLLKRLLKLSICMASLSLSLTLGGCDDSSNVAQCTSDADCREGYSCDLEIYVGECIRRTEVRPCGAVYCLSSEERCVDEVCISLDQVQGGESAGGESAGGESTGGESAGGESAGGESVGGESVGGESVGGESVGGESVGGESTGGESSPPLRELNLTMSQAPSALWYEPHQELELSGQVLTLEGAVPQRIELRMTILPLSEGALLPEGVPPEGLALPIEAEGRFSYLLSLGLGVYQVYLTVIDRGEYDGEILARAEDLIRVDTFVELRANTLYLADRPYRYVGLSTPQLLSWLASLPEETRSSSLRSLLIDLSARGLDVLRVFVGITDGDPRLLNSDRSFNMLGFELLDLLVQEAGRAGLKLIMVLSDGSREMDSLDLFIRANGINMPLESDQNRVFGVGLARDALFSWFESIPNHQNSLTLELYKDDPAILAWELLHLPRWDFSTPLEVSQLEDFLQTAIQVMSTAAPRQLILSGEVGLDYNPTPYQDHAMTLTQGALPQLLNGERGGSWSAIRAWSRPPMRAPLLLSGFSLDGDFLGFEGSPLTWRQLGQAWIRGHALANLSAARPLVIHLARVNREILGDDLAQETLVGWAQDALSQGLNGLIIGDITVQQSSSQVVDPTQNWGYGDPETLSLIEATRARFGP